MAKKKEEKIELNNGRGFCAGAWYTPLQAKGIAEMLKRTIPEWEATHIINKPNPTQKAYLEALYAKLEACEKLASLLNETK